MSYNAHGKFIAKHINSTDSVLDLGCGILQQFSAVPPCEKYLAVDGFFPYLENLVNSTSIMTLQGMLPEVCNQFVDNSWDVVILIDVIEHLEKDDGLLVLDNMYRIARGRVIIDTPLGFIPQEGWDAWDLPHCDLQAHLSGWNIEDFTDRGYVVTKLPNYSLQAGDHESILAVLEKK